MVRGFGKQVRGLLATDRDGRGGLGSVLNKDSQREGDVIQASKRLGAWHGKGLLAERSGMGAH